MQGQNAGPQAGAYSPQEDEEEMLCFFFLFRQRQNFLTFELGGGEREEAPEGPGSMSRKKKHCRRRGKFGGKMSCAAVIGGRDPFSSVGRVIFAKGCLLGGKRSGDENFLPGVAEGGRIRQVKNLAQQVRHRNAAKISRSGAHR